MCLQLAQVFAVPSFADRTMDHGDEDHGYPCQPVLPHRRLISSMVQPSYEASKVLEQSRTSLAMVCRPCQEPSRVTWEVGCQKHGSADMSPTRAGQKPQSPAASCHWQRKTGWRHV